MAQERRAAKKPRVATMGEDDWNEPEASEGEDSEGEATPGRGGAAFPMAGVLEFEGDDEDPVSARQRKLNKKKAKSGGFESLGLSLPIFKGVKRKGYRVPTPIQRKTLPLILAGHDVVAMARTGSGKTAAFLIPMLERLKQHSSRAGARAVILSPTRELALQTFKFCKELGRYTDLRAAVLVGGDSMEEQFGALAQNPDILVATPGRLMHHLSEVEGMSLRSVEYVVFDEADRLFEMGFADQLRSILQHLADTRQTLLFSATLPKLLAEFARAGLRDPQLVRLDADARVSKDLRVQFFTMRAEEKPAALLHLLQEVIPADQQTIIFTATRHHVEFLNELLTHSGVTPSVVYGTMDQTARKIHIGKFRAQKTQLLIVTDVAARGIDIPLLDNVINYDFPPKPKLFVHRVGRAARAGRTGTAFSFVTPEEIPFMLDLHLFLSRPVFPAPTEEALRGAGDEKNDSGDVTVYGRFPQSILDPAMERIRDLSGTYSDLENLVKVCGNAYRLYVKTRPAPSIESVARAKQLPKEGTHPLLRTKVDAAEQTLAAFTEHLKKFRPKQTVLETEGAAAKGERQETLVVTMLAKRAAHEHVIEAARHKDEERPFGGEDNDDMEDVDDAAEAAPTPEPEPAKKRKRAQKGAPEDGRPKKKAKPKSFQDDQFFINAIPPNRFAEQQLSVSGGSGTRGASDFDHGTMDSAILDLVPDDEAGITKKRATYHWDRKKKKYIRLQPGEVLTGSGKVKAESGARVNAGQQKGLYKKWQARTHMKVATAGEEGEDRPAASGRGGHSGRGRGRGGGAGRGGGRGGGRSGPGDKVRSEIRGVEEIRKERQKNVMKMGGASRGRGGRGGRGDRGDERGGRGGRGGGQRGGRGGGRGGSRGGGGAGFKKGGRGGFGGARKVGRGGKR